MVIHRPNDPQAFRAAVWPFLLEREAENNLMLGVAGRVAAGGSSSADPADRPLMLTVEEHGQVIGAALQTPPFNIILSPMAEDTASAVAAHLHAQGAMLPGVLGPKETAAAFATSWSEATRGEARLSQSLRIYQAEAMTPPANVPGQCVVATRDHLETVLTWARSFATETGESDRDLERSTTSRVEKRQIFLWQEGEPVSIAAYAGPTPHGIRVNFVYTPPERRCHGYASALVAAISQRALDGGHRFCFLFADLLNPISNSIYQKIGYRAVCDFDAYEFAGA
jgi:predicted GNAT family acetyltransferase